MLEIRDLPLGPATPLRPLLSTNNVLVISAKLNPRRWFKFVDGVSGSKPPQPLHPTTITIRSIRANYKIQLFFDFAEDSFYVTYTHKRTHDTVTSPKSASIRFITAFRAIDPTIPVEIRIHDCKTHHEFFLNGKQVLNRFRGPYQTYLDEIVYKSPSGFQWSVFENSLSIKHYSSVETYRAKTISLDSTSDRLDGGSEVQDRLGDGVVQAVPFAGSPLLDPGLASRELELEERELEVRSCEKFISERERTIARRLDDVKFREKSVYEKERELMQREMAIHAFFEKYPSQLPAMEQFLSYE